MRIPLYIKELLFLNRAPSTLNLRRETINLTPDTILIFTISFNNLETIKLQNEYLKKNLKDKYKYYVCDNSSDDQISKQIEKYCDEVGVDYLHLMGNPYNGIDVSKSHGIAINWAYRHIIKHSQSKYFGVLDHDIFPIKKTSILKNLKNSPVYGHIQERDDRWYLWPGFSFFNRKILDHKEYNFMPVSGLDTGGGNWKSIFQDINRRLIHVPKHRYIRYEKGDIVQKTSVEMIDSWLHLINASGWHDGNKKENIEKLIRKLLDKDKIIKS